MGHRGVAGLGGVQVKGKLLLGAGLWCRLQRQLLARDRQHASIAVHLHLCRHSQESKSMTNNRVRVASNTSKPVPWCNSWLYRVLCTQLSGVDNVNIQGARLGGYMELLHHHGSDLRGAPVIHTTPFCQPVALAAVTVVAGHAAGLSPYVLTV